MVKRHLWMFGTVVSAITVLIMIDIGCRIFDVYANDATQAGINRAISIIGIIIGLYIIRLLVEDIENEVNYGEDDIEALTVRKRTRLYRPNIRT